MLNHFSTIKSVLTTTPRLALQKYHHLIMLMKCSAFWAEQVSSQLPPQTWILSLAGPQLKGSDSPT